MNLQNPYVVEHLLNAVGMWMDEFGIDGLRLDAADCVDINFFKQLREFCKGKRPDFWLMGEIIHGDYSRWANSDTLDSVTNYECYKGLYSSHNDHNYFEIAHSLQRQFAQGGIYQNLCLYSFLDNHDVDRIASHLKDQEHLKNSYTVMYCMPGVPSIYYGSEWGIKGSRTNNCDDALRPEINLGQIENANEDLNRYLKKLGKVRLTFEPLQFGDYKNEYIRNEQLVFSRSYNNHTIYVALNLNKSDADVEFNAQGGYSKLTDALTNESFDNTGYVRIPVKGNSARILVMNNGEFSLDFDDAPSVITQVEESEPVTKEADTPVVEMVMPLAEVTPGRYRHFKGREYEITSVAEQTETGEKLVIYMDLQTHKYWARPYEMFVELVKVGNKFVRRFDKLS